MESINRPSDVHPALTDDRLKFIVDLISRVRRETLETHDSSSGETNWSLGCRSYERICSALFKEAVSQNHPWLSVQSRNLYFLIKFDRFPIRFYHGDPKKSTPKKLRELKPEVHARQLYFSFAKPTPQNDSHWRLFYETDLDKTVYRATLVQLTKHNEPCESWDIPVGERISSISLVDIEPREAVDIPTPEVGVKRAIHGIEAIENDDN